MSTARPIAACQALIVERLSVRYPTIDYTSRRLGIPVRTLQRRLREQGLSYGQLVEQTRLELACRLLEAPNLRQAEVARALGYADSSSFSRAFRRWLNMSPREYRLWLRSQTVTEG